MRLRSGIEPCGSPRAAWPARVATQILVIIVVALVISSLLRAFIVQVFWIPSRPYWHARVEMTGLLSRMMTR